MAVCTRCGERPDEDFNQDRRRASGLQAWCKFCQHAQNRNRRYDPETRDAVLARDKRIRIACRYGVSLKELECLFELQGRKCASCGSLEPRSKKGWAIDHNHETDEIRGILCQPCNVALGMVEESIERLHQLEAYLRKFQKALGMGATN